MSVCRFFLSNLKLKIATALEMMTILCPEYFLVMGSCANCLKVGGWVGNRSFGVDTPYTVADHTKCARGHELMCHLPQCGWVGVVIIYLE